MAKRPAFHPIDDRRRLRRALCVITEGEQAPIRRRLRPWAEGVKRSSAWASGSAVQGIGIAPKRVGGEDTDQLALRVFVNRKRRASEVDDPVPEAVDLDEFGESVITDVVEVGEVMLHANTRRVDPAKPGFSISHEGQQPGTLGCVVWDRQARDWCVLSCYHVIGGTGRAQAEPGIYQPSPAEMGNDHRLIANYRRHAELDDGRVNFVDAGIAAVDDPETINPSIHGLGIPTGTRKIVRLNTEVQKMGRNGYSKGVVQAHDVTHTFDYMLPRGNSVPRRAHLRLAGLVACSPYASGGDSGAAVLDDRRRVIGLHVAGSSSVSYFCMIRHVMTALDIEVFTWPEDEAIPNDWWNHPPTG